MQTWDAPPSSDNLLVGKGSVFFNRFDANGVGTGLKHLGNVDAMEISQEDDKIEKYENMTAAASLYASVTRRRNVRIALTLTEFHPENLALAQMGNLDETYTQAATAVVDEVLTESLVKGATYQFAKLGPYTGVSLSDESGALVLGTDYVITDPLAGLVTILAGGGATAGDTLEASYTPTAYAAGAVPKVKGGQAGEIIGSLLFVGDPTAGPKLMVKVWKVSFTPDGALGLISEEFADMALTGAVLADPVGHPGNTLYETTYLPTS